MSVGDVVWEVESEAKGKQSFPKPDQVVLMPEPETSCVSTLSKRWRRFSNRKALCVTVDSLRNEKGFVHRLVSNLV